MGWSLGLVSLEVFSNLNDSVIGTSKGIWASQAWHLPWFYVLFGQTKAASSVAGWWKSSVGQSSRVCFIPRSSALKLLVMNFCCCFSVAGVALWFPVVAWSNARNARSRGPCMGRWLWGLWSPGGCCLSWQKAVRSPGTALLASVSIAVNSGCARSHPRARTWQLL